MNEKVQATEAISYIGDIGKMIGDLSFVLYQQQLSGVERVDSLLDSTMEFFDADRAYVIVGDMDPICADNIYERCAPGKSHQQDTLKDLPPESYQYWLGQYMTSQITVITDMNQVKKDRPNEYRYFCNSNVESLILAPFHKGEKRGFVGVDNPRRYVEQPRAIAVIAYIIANELNEMDLLESREALMKASDYPEGTVEIKLMGNLEVRAKGGTLSADDFGNQGLALLTALFLKSNQHMSNEEIIAGISLAKDSANPNGLVSTAVHRLRQRLQIIGLKDLILPEHDGCSANTAFDIKVDTNVFTELAEQIKVCKNMEEKLQMCHQALDIYKPLKPVAYQSVTGTLAAGNLNMMFLRIAKACSNIHIKRREYDDAYYVIQNAITENPTETVLLLEMARLYKVTGKSRVARLLHSLSGSISMKHSCRN